MTPLVRVSQSLLLVALEKVHKVDLSRLDETYRAISYVGVNQSFICLQLGQAEIVNTLDITQIVEYCSWKIECL